MLIGMSKQIICKRIENRKSHRWQLLQVPNTAPAYGRWDLLEITPEIDTDEMHLALLAMAFPTADVELFLLAVNHPDRVPMRRDLRAKDD